jgi:UDP-3-O-[3-hydroxymyristoyl] N-acetylglucosamine deacetylase/3-hydroxyacyl-[acyl-carrier-protein] dehydratase
MLFKDSARHLHTGYINKEGLRFPNECARHKTVDLLGDLMLAGKRLHALVAAHKPGHKANVAVARMIRNQCLDNESSAKI